MPTTTNRIALPKVEVVPIDSIRPYTRNARRNDAAVPAVKESIQRYGLNQPLVVNRRGVIIVGHTRYRALLELGATQVPVIRPKLTKAQEDEYRIADNKTAEFASWDEGLLIPELRALSDAGWSMEPFFGEKDLSRLLAEGSGQGYDEIDDEKLDRALDRQVEGMDKLIQSHVGAHIELACPHCGESIVVERSVVEKHRGEAAA